MSRTVIFLLALATLAPGQGATVLWYRQPAAKWVEALPVGNGRLGAMVHGGIRDELIQLNEDTIWAGAPLDRVRKGAWKHLARARELFFAGKVVEGQRLMQKEFMSERLVRSYQPLGDLRWKEGRLETATLLADGEGAHRIRLGSKTRGVHLRAALRLILKAADFE